jgi:hypothetical protein
MKDKLKERLQCRGCIMPYCDIPCDDLTDDRCFSPKAQTNYHKFFSKLSSPMNNKEILEISAT